MSKKLKIEAPVCQISTNKYGDVDINGTGIEKIINSKLPTLEPYKQYLANISIEIKIWDFEPIDVKMEGYTLQSEIEEPTENNEVIEEEPVNETL